MSSLRNPLVYRRTAPVLALAVLAAMHFAVAHAESGPVASAPASASASSAIPLERGPVPSAAAWREAVPFALSRTRPGDAHCNGERLGAWVRIRCPGPTFAVTLAAGAADGVSFWIGLEAEGSWAQLQLPLAPGDRRVIQLFRPAKDASGGVVPEASLTVQEHWLPGAPAPTIVAL